MQRKWVHTAADPAKAKALSAELNIDPIIGSILIQRGIETFEGARAFFRPSLESLHDPFLMKDMDLAVNRLSQALAHQEKILIYGDYDVDGTTAVSVMYLFLKKFTQNIEFYIPDRYTEGYGISEKGINHAASTGCHLVIALDCGIRANKMASLAKKLNVDLIICDHHIPGPELPDALAILDPKRSDCPYPFKELSGCGVGFKLLQGFCLQNTIDLSILYQYLDLVAVSIGSDIVPIIGENRILAYFGMRKLNQDPNLSLASLIKIAGIKSPISISDVVFYIGPRINAAGRMRHASESVQLLICQDPEQLESFSNGLNQVNNQRKDVDQSITESALQMIQETIADQAKSTVLFDPNWHKGIVGIVASRCIEKYYRPTIILTESNGVATGSARSVDGFDVHQAIGQCADLLIQYGGHAHAAGMSLALTNVPHFQEKFEQVVASTIDLESQTPKLMVDSIVALSFINFKNFNILTQMEPFGPANMQPVFITENVRLAKPPTLIKEKHLKIEIGHSSSEVKFDAIGFGFGDQFAAIGAVETFQIAYHISLNDFRGNKRLQLIIKDIKYYN
jgi:single-stranded-DNA-specific exonuclease